jgi:hypothetical protein
MTQCSRRTDGYIALASPVSLGSSLIHRLPYAIIQHRYAFILQLSVIHFSQSPRLLLSALLRYE